MTAFASRPEFKCQVCKGKVEFAQLEDLGQGLKPICPDCFSKIHKEGKYGYSKGKRKES